MIYQLILKWEDHSEIKPTVGRLAQVGICWIDEYCRICCYGIIITCKSSSLVCLRLLLGIDDGHWSAQPSAANNYIALLVLKLPILLGITSIDSPRRRRRRS